MPATLPLAFPAFIARPLTGQVELAVAEAVAATDTRPRRVTRLLLAALGSIDGSEVTEDLVRRLPASTREWLLQQSAAVFRSSITWLTGRCTKCGGIYDISLELAKMPVSRPGPGFPRIQVITSQGTVTFDVPNGEHEEKVSASGLGGINAQQLLVSLCSSGALPSGCTAEDHAKIDEALDHASPDVADCSEVKCPTCGEATRSRVDPLSFAFPQERRLLHEIHLIAAAYGWSETAILALPRARRLTYLSFIEPRAQQLRSA